MSRVLSFCLLLLLGAEAAAAKTAEYVVRRDDTLKDIAVRLYGDVAAWHEIAEWNHLKNPNHLFVGTRLTLKKAPTVSEEEGNRLLLTRWRGYLENHQPKVDPSAPAANLDARAPASIKTPPPAPAEPSEKVYSEAEEKRFQTALNQAKVEAWKEDRKGYAADFLLSAGQELFEKNDYEHALPKFQRSRQLDPEPVSVWIYEIRTLKALNREPEARATAKQFADRHPAMQNLPLIRGLLR